MTRGHPRGRLAGMPTSPTLFLDRADAGRRLAELLGAMADERPIVVALPRGGVPVAAQVAAALRAPLQLLEVRKIGAPSNPELALGAIAEDGTIVLRRGLEAEMGLTSEQLQATVDREQIELRRRAEAYAVGEQPLDVRGRTVILVDDGMATGLTALAAVRALRGRGARRIVVAVPVASAEAFALLQDAADEMVCATVPRDLRSVGEWFRDFRQVSDREVREALQVDGHHPLGHPVAQPVDIPAAGGVTLHGDLVCPPGAGGTVIFAHGSGSSRHSPRNRAVAETLQHAGFATLLLDLLTEDEALHRATVFDIPLLTRRMEHATRWVLADPRVGALPVGYFGASTGAAAALRAAAVAHDTVRAIVSRGGRVDLAVDRLSAVTAPTLLVVGSLDRDVLELNRRAATQLGGPHRIAVIQGAGHLFEEPGTLDAVATLAADWFSEHLPAASARIALAGDVG
jgi:predicted phosphoribosyltransferase/dienelactone hydrolase